MANPFELRKALYEEHLGEVDSVFEDTDPADPRYPKIDILGFERDFSSEEDETDDGWVLVTSGMSDRRMQLDEEALEGEAPPRAELVWYVREPSDEIIENLRWLARFPFLEQTWLGMGHTIPMPQPIFEGSALTTFFFLPPIITMEQEIAENLRIDGDGVELYVVHLLTAEEYALKKSEGTDAILDLFDDNDYGFILDPERDSMVSS